MDDWLLTPLKESERRDLMEVIEDQSEHASTLIANQLPIKDWHAVIDDPNQADALCDRVLHNAHRIELKGPSIAADQDGAQRSRKTEGGIRERPIRRRTPFRKMFSDAFPVLSLRYNMLPMIQHVTQGL
jgi:IstB-like ATP binding protein